jgi:hypothetical protein
MGSVTKEVLNGTLGYPIFILRGGPKAHEQLNSQSNSARPYDLLRNT